MALVAKMQAQQVTGLSGHRYVECEPDDPEAIEAKDASGLDSYYGRPPWLAGATHVKTLRNAQAQESFVLGAVSAKDDVDDPNRAWAAASPSGKLEMVVNNPEAWGYIVPGAEYRVTIERIRGSRPIRVTGNTFGVHDGSGNTVS